MPDWNCPHHPDVDWNTARGCPDCLADLRDALADEVLSQRVLTDEMKERAMRAYYGEDAGVKAPYGGGRDRLFRALRAVIGAFDD